MAALIFFLHPRGTPITMKLALLCTLLASAVGAQAACPSSLRLKGTISLKSCAASEPNCVAAGPALYKYTKANKDDRPDVLSISITGSPWRLYDRDSHILEIDELAKRVRQEGKAIKRVVLKASWSGTAPDARTISLADKLSAALGGIPVSGKDGFLWISRNGATRTTQQAFTIARAGSYSVPEGEEIMVARVSGWLVDLEGEFTRTGNAKGLLLAAVGQDTYMLCPERALQLFEAAAKMSEPVAAFNAAIMRLERGAPGDAAAATALLRQSAAAGDRKAQSKLEALGKTRAAATAKR